MHVANKSIPVLPFSSLSGTRERLTGNEMVPIPLVGQVELVYDAMIILCVYIYHV